MTNTSSATDEEFVQFREQGRRNRQKQRPKMMIALLQFAWCDPKTFDCDDWRRAVDLLEHLHTHAWLEERGVVPPDRLLPRAQASHVRVRKVHAELNRALATLFPVDDHAFWKRRSWHPPVRAHRPALMHYHKRLFQVVEATWPDTIWIVTMSLLEEFGQRLRRCPTCEVRRLFLKTRRQMYCSAACSQRARSARWYNRNRRAER
jgi:hypothetical protein